MINCSFLVISEFGNLKTTTNKIHCSIHTYLIPLEIFLRAFYSLQNDFEIKYIENTATISVKKWSGYFLRKRFFHKKILL